MRLKLAIVGLGAAARHIHLPAYATLPALEVVGGCDLAPPAGRLPFPVFPTVDALLATTRPDLLAVVTPPETHYELARTGLAHGCHVFCEKPLTTNLDDAMDLVERSRRAGRWVVVNNQFRFMNIHSAARKQIGTPEFGELRFLDAQQTFRTTADTEAGWRGRGRRHTCQEFGTHVLDLCRFFFDEDPISITARMPRGNRPDDGDYLNLIDLEFSGNRVAHVTLDRWTTGRHRYLDLRLDGTAGSVETHVGGGVALSLGIQGGSRRPFARLDIAMGGQARLYRGERFTRIATDPIRLFSHATSRLLDAFLDALARDVTPPCHADDNRKTLALMLAAYDSADTRRTVEMTY